MKTLKNISTTILNAYSQLFFSKNNWFAVLLALSTFIKWEIGVAGLIALLASIFTGKILGFSPVLIKDGTYTFNGLMTGMALAIYFEFTGAFVFLLILSGALSFFISLWILNWASPRNIPLLSWTFIIVTWLALLGASNFTSFEFINHHVTKLSNSPLSGLAGRLDGWLNQVGLPDLVRIYLRSLGAIMFQYNTLAGLIIFVGLLLHSRIATILSILGFFIGFLFYSHFEGDFTQLIFSYIGFNFILTSIALGGFFIVPHWKSYLLVIAIVPIMAIIISALSKFFSPFGLPLFSLPFCIVVTLLLLTLQLRVNPKNITLVREQQFTPEENHYKTVLTKKRFGNQPLFHLQLPFHGTWNVSQGYDGGITHIGEWQHALDFDIRNDNDKTYNEPGFELKDYLCYELPIFATANGYIVKVEDSIVENPVRGVNLEQNWGNTVIIKHGEGLYSKVSHLKTETIKVKEGDYVQKGDLIGKLGNSGRSPEPHLHFQLQSTPFIGSKTIPYPLAYYLVEKSNGYHLNKFSIPKEGEKVRNIDLSPALKKVFGFIPGQSLKWTSGSKKYSWDIHTDALNRTYIYSKEDSSYAYFVNNGTSFYFTDFEGSKKSPLFLFYLGVQNILLSEHENILMDDEIHIKYLTPKWLKSVHDLTAPFFHFITCNYSSKCINESNNEIKIQSKIKTVIGKKSKQTFKFEAQITQSKLKSFQCIFNNQKYKFECE